MITKTVVRFWKRMRVVEFAGMLPAWISGNAKSMHGTHGSGEPSCGRKRHLMVAAYAVGLLVTMQVGYAQQRLGQLVPASLSPRTDGQGFRWDLHQYGYVQRGSNSCFGNAFVLTVNGNSFNSNRRMMTKDGSEIIFYGTAGGLQVTRYVRINQKSATIRYVDVFKNPGSTPVTASVRLQTSLGNNQAQATVTSSGTPATTSLGPKDSGLLVFANPSGSQLSVLFFLCGPKSKLKPALKIQSNYRFYFTYPLSIAAGKSKAIIHGAAQRRLASLPRGKDLERQFKPFLSRSWTRGNPSDVRRSIANLRSSAFAGEWGRGQVLLTLDSLDVEQLAVDVLAVGDETRLQGNASCSSISLETPYGKFQPPLARIAAMVGSKFGSRPRLFLRDGQVIQGKLATEELSFALKSGVRLRLQPEGLDRLVMRLDKAEDADESIAAMIETIEGDRLALSSLEGSGLQLTTPWGDRDVEFKDIIELTTSTEPIGHRISLRDGTRLFGFINQEHVSFETREFGLQDLPTVQLRAIYSARDSDESDSDFFLIRVPHLLLAGENLVLGAVDLASLKFRAAGQEIPIPPNQIRVMRNITNELADSTDLSVYFEAELWDGSTLRGALARQILPVRSADGVLQVPVREIAEVRVPTPTVPDALRARIALLIRDLGHVEFETREEATKGLAELGYLAKLQLDEASQQVTDPEAKRRIEALLEELSE